ncbi:hypothetical protein ACROYT_G040152 [Oculina patagonica]
MIFVPGFMLRKLGIELSSSTNKEADEDDQEKERKIQIQKERKIQIQKERKIQIQKERKKRSSYLMETIKRGNFDDIKEEVTPRVLKECEPNSLLMGMKVNFELHKLADRKGADEERFDQLANTVEAFINSLLDPLRSDKKSREEFGVHFLDHIIDDAIDFNQKKFFTHPAVEDEMERKFHGREPEKSGWNWWQLLLYRFFCFWCALDLLFLPILFTVFSQLEKRREEKEENVNEEGSKEAIPDEIVCRFSLSKDAEEVKPESRSVFTVKTLCQIYSTPYAKYIRDAVSYIVLVVLHYALCLSPSTIEFSRFEWVILIFFVGRYLVECQQIRDILQRIKKRKDIGVQSKWILLKTILTYVSDPWNLLDFISLLVYFIILILRVATLVQSGSVMNNRVLAIAGYFYSLNTLCLTLRVFGNITEQSRHLGVIQIALFGILKDMTTIILQFVASILAFSIAITKVYMAEQSFVANGNAGNENTCRSSGLSCWWVMVGHLGWSLLGVSGESDPLVSVDASSEHIARILYAAFIIFGVILLLNMLIALLSNTYQRTEENSFKVWSIKKAITIQTYDAYDPVPVPLNIVYNIGKLFCRLAKSQDKTQVPWIKKSLKVINDLEEEYFTVHENLFPLTDKNKVDRVLQETEKNRQMVSQILNTTFESQSSDQGVDSKMWKFNRRIIRIEGLLLTYDGGKGKWGRDTNGARYLKPFSPEFPHFEVIILETGGKRLLGIGAVEQDYDTSEMPGWENGSVGYHADDGIIYHNIFNEERTKGPVLARRGDRIRCTVLFKKDQDGNKHVSVMFSLNGNRMMITQKGEEGEGDGEEEGGEGGEGGEFSMDSDCALYPYICMTHGYSVLAKMCPREVKDLDSKVRKSLEETNQNVNTSLEELVKEVEKNREETNRKLEELVKDVRKNKEETNKKLDALLARLADSKNDQQNTQPASAKSYPE